MSPATETKTVISQAIDPNPATAALSFLESIGVSDSSVDDFTSADFYSDVICHHLRVISVSRGRLSCSLTVRPAIANFFKGLHGSAVAAIAEKVSIACARTVVTDEKDIFLGELSISYLSSAPINAELIVEGSVVRSGRNVTVVTLEFKIKDAMKLAYIARATFYNSPISKL